MRGVLVGQTASTGPRSIERGVGEAAGKGAADGLGFNGAALN